MLRTGWTDRGKVDNHSHKYLSGAIYPLCASATAYYYIMRNEVAIMSTRTPKNACKNCLRIAKIRKKFEWRKKKGR